MPGDAHNIFQLELDLLARCEALARDAAFQDNPLLPCYQELTSAYRKLLRQTQHLIKISDQYQNALSACAEEMTTLSQVDALTQLANRRALQQHLDTQWRLHRRDGKSLAILMIDIDHFKTFNDAYGHLQGDACLRAVADAIQKSLLRTGDFAARYGGDEFVAVLPSTGPSDAATVARRIVANVKALRLVHAASPVAAMVTVSAGFAATVPTAIDGATALLREADRALYRAKLAGSDQALASEPLPEIP